MDMETRTVEGYSGVRSMREFGVQVQIKGLDQNYFCNSLCRINQYLGTETTSPLKEVLRS